MADETIPDVLSKYYPGGIYGKDRDGRPIYYEPLGRIDFVGLLHSVKVEEIVKYKRKHCLELKEICEQQQIKLSKELNTFSTLVLDAEGGSRSHLWRPGIESYSACIELYEKEFPNLRERIIIINAPIIFPIIYALLKPFMTESSKKKVKVLGSNWRTEILEYIDKDNIPEFYGGTGKDSEDNPKCEEFICYGGEVPKSYYVSENVNKEEFENTTVKAGSKFTKEVEIIAANTKIVYKFITNDFDIKFSVEYKPQGDGECVTLINERKFDSQLTMEEGEIICEGVGTYLFSFDNSYSWIREKELFYYIEQMP